MRCGLTFIEKTQYLSFSEGIRTPLSVYMSKVKDGLLTEDAYQKNIVASLDCLNDQLSNYRPPVKSHALIQKVGLFI